MDKLQQSIQFAKQNPESPYATELRRRIESGQLDNELSKSGLSQQFNRPVIQQQDSILQTIVKEPVKTLLVKPAARATEAITRVAAPNSLATKGFEAMADEGTTQSFNTPVGNIDITQQKAIGEGGGKQIAGDVLQVGSYLFPFGRAAKLGTAVTGSKVAGNVLSGATGGFLADAGFGLEGGETVSEALTPGLGTAIGAGIPVIGAGIGAATKGLSKVPSILKPKQGIDDTIGRIIQGETSDIPLAKKALNAVDTTGIKTRSDLSERLKSSMDKQMQIVDTELLKDPRVKTLDDFAIRTTNKAGQEVKFDSITEALNNLDEFYNKSGDPTSASNLNLIRQKAITEGLTNKEVNDIARLYSEEFGAKAFNKLGDPLTSVNAQKFQNVRDSLKQAARGGLGFGEEAKQADRLYSAMNNTKRLIDKGVEGVNKLQQRISERSLLEKLGRGTVNAIDTFSGGFLGGAIRGATKSNVGLKTLNWLDLEKKLQSDLDFLSKVDSIKSDNELVNFLKSQTSKMKFPGDALVDDLKKTNKR